jgi:hypothetical protein
MTAENLYLLLESSLSTATRLTDVYRASDDAERELAYLQVELEGALGAVKALRRRYVVTM